jgi:hypothetical protein
MCCCTCLQVHMPASALFPYLPLLVITHVVGHLESRLIEKRIFRWRRNVPFNTLLHMHQNWIPSLSFHHVWPISQLNITLQTSQGAWCYTATQANRLTTICCPHRTLTSSIWAGVKAAKLQPYVACISINVHSVQFALPLLSCWGVLMAYPKSKL